MKADVEETNAEPITLGATLVDHLHVKYGIDM